MKKITVPADISLLLKSGAVVPYTFKQFVESMVDDTAFGKNLIAVESRISIKRAIECSNGIMELTSTDWETLERVVREPTNPYVPAVAEQLLPYIYAIVHPS